MGPSRPEEAGTAHRQGNREQSATGSHPRGRSGRTRARDCVPRYAASAAGACIPLFVGILLEAQTCWRLIGDFQSEGQLASLAGGLSLDERQVRLVCTCLECAGKSEKIRGRASSTLVSSPKCLSDAPNSECAESVRSLTQNEQMCPTGQTRLGVLETGSNTSAYTGRQP